MKVGFGALWLTNLFPFYESKKKIELFVEDVEIQYDYNDETDTEIDAEDIQRLIDNLPEGYKIVFVMYAIEGYKHHEIAELLNISEGTSKSQLFKARKLLKEQINKFNNTSYGIK